MKAKLIEVLAPVVGFGCIVFIMGLLVWPVLGGIVMNLSTTVK